METPILPTKPDVKLTATENFLMARKILRAQTSIKVTHETLETVSTSLLAMTVMGKLSSAMDQCLELLIESAKAHGDTVVLNTIERVLENEAKEEVNRVLLKFHGRKP